MTIKQAMEKAIVNFKLEKIESPVLKARMLMQHTLQKPREYLVIYDSKPLTKEQEQKYLAGIKTIQKGIPIEHITHQKEFMKLNFYVDENVLIPRQDTEILVEEAIKLAKGSGFDWLKLANQTRNLWSNSRFMHRKWSNSYFTSKVYCK